MSVAAKDSPDAFEPASGIKAGTRKKRRVIPDCSQINRMQAKMGGGGSVIVYLSLAGVLDIGV